jgi:hypothetical protein
MLLLRLVGRLCSRTITTSCAAAIAAAATTTSTKQQMRATCLPAALFKSGRGSSGPGSKAAVASEARALGYPTASALALSAFAATALVRGVAAGRPPHPGPWLRRRRVVERLQRRVIHPQGGRCCVDGDAVRPAVGLMLLLLTRLPNVALLVVVPERQTASERRLPQQRLVILVDGVVVVVAMVVAMAG